MKLLHFLNVTLRRLLQFAQQALDLLFILVHLSFKRGLLLGTCFDLRLQHQNLRLLLVKLSVKVLTVSLRLCFYILELSLQLVNLFLVSLLDISDVVSAAAFASQFFFQALVLRDRQL